MHFLIEAKSLLSSPGKMIGEQYMVLYMHDKPTTLEGSASFLANEMNVVLS